MATVNYNDQAALKNSNIFLDRCSVAVAKYVNFILGNNQATVSQSQWARSIINSNNFTGEVQRIIWSIIWDPAILALTSPVDQTVITDIQLQTIVETAINNTIAKF